MAFAAAIREHGGPPDVVIDLVGGPYVTAEVAAIAPRGRIVVVGTLAGGMPAVPLLGLMQQRAEMHGTVLRPRSIDDKAAATDAFVAEVLPLLADGRVRPVVDTVFPLAAVADAYALVATDTTFGKVILDAGAPTRPVGTARSRTTIRAPRPRWRTPWQLSRIPTSSSSRQCVHRSASATAA